MMTITKTKQAATTATSAPQMAKMPAGPQGRKFDAAQKQQALMLLASGVRPAHVAATIGTSTQSLRRWVAREGAMPSAPAPAPKVKAKAARVSRAKRVGAIAVPVSAPPPPTTVKARAKRDDSAGAAASTKPRSPYAPPDPAHGLSDIEVAGILEWKKKHPSMGAAQLRAQLKRFNGWWWP